MSFIKNEDGAALISVLLLVSVMSAAMIATFDELGLFTKNIVSRTEYYQADQFAHAAEIVGANQAVKLAKNQMLAAVMGIDDDRQKVTFPIDGGTVKGELAEYSNCFNLNSLVTANNAEGFEINQIGYEQYIQLLREIGIGERQAQSLAAALVDWQDTDDRPMQSGAESFSYSQAVVPYRAANYPIRELNELRLVRGYTPELIEVLSKFTCVDPLSLQTVVNLNSIRPDQAIFIRALLGPEYPLEAIRSVIEERPAAGYDNVARFWNNPLLKNKEIDNRIRKQFQVSAKRYRLSIEVEYFDARISRQSVILIKDDGTYELISRTAGT
ncbi:MAG: type II secretion system minor pseudopilin GspK [Kordiimonadaceae bacterium]|nr:type II secretion system minor pseudopilin GspK [Kordiimonadaceae bacterium]